MTHASDPLYDTLSSHSVQASRASDTPHIPVLRDEVLHYLDIQPSDTVLDGTIGFGGHAAAILSQLGPDGTYIGLDQDHAAIHHCAAAFQDDNRVHLFQLNYESFPFALNTLALPSIDKVLIDIGMSSMQLDSAERGFRFSEDAPLDMRMDLRNPVTAADLLNTLSAQALSDLFFQFGELHQNKRLVQSILSNRPIHTSNELVSLIKHSYFFNQQRRAFMKTTAQVFQALRIAVNREIEVLDSFLTQLFTHSHPGTRLAVISFHSLEDRLVKQFIQRNKDRLWPLHKKVITASESEIAHNTRAHSAKLRAVQFK